jgi:hypothetical protein
MCKFFSIFLELVKTDIPCGRAVYYTRFPPRDRPPRPPIPLQSLLFSEGECSISVTGLSYAPDYYQVTWEDTRAKVQNTQYSHVTFLNLQRL